MKKILLRLCVLIASSLSTQVSAQSIYTFTSAGATGSNGPTQVQLDAQYNGTPLQGAVTSSSGIQIWTVPSSGLYSIEALGAQGGGSNGGLGASITGEFFLNGGDVLHIVVGQQGLEDPASPNGVGGGGGSFVVKAPALAIGDILVIAGGGGGAASTIHPDRDASATNNGNDGLVDGGVANPNGAGGTAGSGGEKSVTGCSLDRGGGGGGFLTDGGDVCQTPGAGDGGDSFLNGADGGTSSGAGSTGGFGGGGATWSTGFRGSGGGGGYSGGGAGQINSNTPGHAGGGGGSYNIGLNPTNIGGFNSGNGEVVISPLSAPAPNNTGVNFFINPTFVNNIVCEGFSSVDAVIQNFGSNQINSLNIDWTFGGVAQPTVSYSSLLDTFGGVGNSVDTVNLGTINITGNSELVAWTSMPNGNMDTINNNDTASLVIDSVITIELDLGPDVAVCSGSFILLENLGSNQVYSSYTWSTGASTPTIITNTPGTYSVSVTYGPPQCFAADQIIVTSAPTPVVDLGPDSTYCANDFVLDAGGDGVSYVWSDGNNTQTNTVSNSGNYSVTVTSSEGCITEDDINLTLLETPVIDLGEDFKLCISFNQTRLLSAGNSFASYLWSTGATTSNIVVGGGVTTVGSQSYSVTVTADNGCEGGDEVDVEYSMCVGIDENINNSNVSIFPNPANDLVTFIAESSTIAEVQIFDLTGKMIYSNFSSSSRLEVNTSNYASGTYIVKVITENESATRRLIVQ